MDVIPLAVGAFLRFFFFLLSIACKVDGSERFLKHISV